MEMSGVISGWEKRRVHVVAWVAGSFWKTAWASEMDKTGVPLMLISQAPQIRVGQCGTQAPGVLGARSHGGQIDDWSFS